MKPYEYLDEVKARITSSAIVTAFRVTEQDSSLVDGYFRAILSFRDGSRLEAMEYVRVTKGAVEVKRYSFHWMDADNQLRLRWDNAEHYRNLPNYPHHLHDGDEKIVVPSEPMNLLKVLDLIAGRLDT